MEPNPTVDRLYDRLKNRGERRDYVVRLYLGHDHKTDGFEEELVKRLAADIEGKRIAIVQDIEEADLYTPMVCAGNLVSPEFEVDLEKALQRVGHLAVLPIWLFHVVGVDHLQIILSKFGGVPGRDRTWFDGPDREDAWADVLRGIRHMAARLVEYRNLRTPDDD